MKKKTLHTLNKNLIKFINWFSIYNLVSKGILLRMCLGDKTFLSKEVEPFINKIESKSIKFKLNLEQKKCLNEIKNRK